MDNAHEYSLSVCVRMCIMCVCVGVVESDKQNKISQSAMAPKVSLRLSTQQGGGVKREGWGRGGLGKRAADEHEKWLSHCRHVFIHNPIRIHNHNHNHKWQMQMQRCRVAELQRAPLLATFDQSLPLPPPTTPTTARGRCLLISHDKLQLQLGRSKGASCSSAMGLGP